MNLSNKTILITGANGGLGSALVKYAQGLNAKKIYCTARNTKSLEHLKNQENIEILELDITNKISVENFSMQIQNIDILINNAGFNSNQVLNDNIKTDFEVNVFGTLNICEALKNKINKGGSIVNITSILALINLPIMALYCASKSALHSITQALRAELANKEVYVHEILPGPIDTAMTKGQEMPKTSPEEIAKAIFEGIENKEEEILPDEFSKEIYKKLLTNPKALEKEFALSVKQ